MGRWAPNAQSRLEQAALALYTQRGFTNTTVVQIAEQAGLTERTFFRYFMDKREVLFADAAVLQRLFVEQIADAPPAFTPLEAIARALEAVAADFQARADTVRQRNAVLAANPELRERELMKLAALAGAIAVAFKHRGVSTLAEY